MAQAAAHGKAERRRKGRSQRGWDEQQGRRSGVWTPAAGRQPPWGRGGARLPSGVAGCWWRRRAGEVAPGRRRGSRGRRSSETGRRQRGGDTGACWTGARKEARGGVSFPGARWGASAMARERGCRGEESISGARGRTHTRGERVRAPQAEGDGDGAVLGIEREIEERERTGSGMGG